MVGGSALLILNYSIVFNVSDKFVSYYEYCEAGALVEGVEDEVDDVSLWMQVLEQLRLGVVR